MLILFEAMMTNDEEYYSIELREKQWKESIQYVCVYYYYSILLLLFIWFVYLPAAVLRVSNYVTVRACLVFTGF